MVCLLPKFQIDVLSVQVIFIGIFMVNNIVAIPVDLKQADVEISVCYYVNSDLNLPPRDNINANSQVLPAPGYSNDLKTLSYMLSDNSNLFNSPTGQTPTTKAPASKKPKQSNTKQAQAKDSKPTSYIMNRLRVNEHVYNHLMGLTKDFNQPTREFFFHVLGCSLLPQNMKDGEWMPIPNTTIYKEWKHGSVRINLLIKAGLLERTAYYSIEMGICYCYRIPVEILEELSKLQPSTVKELRELSYYNLMDGKKISIPKSCVLTYQYGDKQHQIPDTIRRAFDGIEKCYLNLKAVETYLRKAELGAKTEKQKRKLWNDKRCFDSIIWRLNYNSISEEVSWYTPSYEAQMSGRITELEGGLQSCSRAMKKAAFSFDNCHNYDLKSSQVNILMWWFKQAGISTGWLKNYLRLHKEDWAKEIGISVDCLKSIMCSRLMGAELPDPDSDKYWDKEAGKYKKFLYDLSVLEYLLKEAMRQNGNVEATLKDQELARTFLRRFRTLIWELHLQLEEFYEWLVNVYCKDNSDRGTVKNLTGMKFNLKEYQDSKGGYKSSTKRELYRRLTAFFLQGTEAAFIHHLTRKEIQEKYKYKVISNAHDGVVTINKIPEAAMEEARAYLGIDCFHLEEKPICSKEEEEWWLNT